MEKLYNRIMLEICWAIESVIDYFYPENTIWISYKYECKEYKSKEKDKK